MQYIDYLGFFAGALILASLVPQIIKSWKTKETKDISLAMFVIYLIGVVAWLIYGILIKNLPMTVTNIICLFLASINLCLKIKYK